MIELNQTNLLFQEIGFNRRMSRIFKNNDNVLVIGLDHGTSMGVLDGIEDIRKISNQFLEAKSDAILLGPKASTWAGKELGENVESSLWLRLNRTNAFDPKTPDKWRISTISAVEDAIRLDADAVVLWYIRDVAGGQTADDYEELIANTASKCRSFGIPLVVEALTIGENNDSDLIDTARIAYELGADILKINYPNSTTTLKEIVDSVDIPVLLAGGPAGDENEFYELMAESMKTGIKGLVIGRNIWQSDDPKHALEELNKIVHK